MKGEAGRALGMSAVASAIGGIFSVIVLIIAAPLLARVAYSFGPPEYFALAVFGLSMVALTGGDSAVKNLIAGAFGVLLATVGQDITTGVERYTFGIYSLHRRHRIHPGADRPVRADRAARAGGAARQAHRRSPSSARCACRAGPTSGNARRRSALSSVLGTFIGVLPALGATTAAMIAYVETKRWSKNKEEFGKGAIEGVAGPEAANNAAVGGAMVPTLALGIPGSTTTAIILAGLIVQGVRPGPHLFTEQPLLLYAVFSSMLLANLLYLALGLGFAKLFARITLIPPQFLWPAVFVLSVIGAYAPNQAMAEVWVAIAFGFIGFFMRRFGFSPAPLVIGPGARQAGRGDAQAVAHHLRPELERLPRPPDRDDALRPYRAVPARTCSLQRLRAPPMTCSISRRTRTAVAFASKATSLHFDRLTGGTPAAAASSRARGPAASSPGSSESAAGISRPTTV